MLMFFTALNVILIGYSEAIMTDILFFAVNLKLL